MSHGYTAKRSCALEKVFPEAACAILLLLVLFQSAFSAMKLGDAPTSRSFMALVTED